MLVDLMWYLRILRRGGYYFDRCIGSKGGSGSSVKVIHAINFYKAISIREWHTSFSLEEYEY